MIASLRRMVFLTASVALAALTGLAQSDPESRVLAYIRDHLQAGQPLVVTQLYNNVFTTPEEHKALDKLYNAFFRIPLFVAQYQQKFGAPPTRKVIAEQFDLRTPEAAGVLIQVMESDPRVPRFFSRDEKTGEITAVDAKTILADPRFGKAAERQLSGWEGRVAPAFKLSRLEGGDVDSSALRGKVVLLYVWFTGCPPCMKETPQLVTLARDFASEGVAIVGANADRVLGLDYDDAVRLRYAQEHHIHFPLVHWTRESDAAFGSVAIYPTLFLMDPTGLVARHWIGYVSGQEIRAAITKSLKAGPK